MCNPFRCSMPSELPFSVTIQGPRLRDSSHERPWTLENGEPCRLHNLCASCKAVIRKSSLIHGSILWIVPSFEYFTLHETMEIFEASVKDRCHLCTLIWTQMADEIDVDLITEYRTCPVFLRIKADEEFGTAELDLIARVGPEPGIEAAELKWDEWRYGEIPLSKLALRVGHYMMRGEIFSILDDEDRYDPHVAHGESWLSECLKYHDHCKKPQPEFHPSRLLEIDFPNVQLRLMNPGNTCPPYCALSHCWGGAADIPVLNAGNLELLQAGIAVEGLPKSFREAITVTHALGLKHIWIDCLCIIQDSPDDWTTESAVMGSIYENASCTILAAAASDAHKGCFWERDPLSYAPCRVAGSGDNSLFASDARLRNYGRDEVDRPLLRRAWTFQERILSTRVLDFNKFGVSWRCAQGGASEMQPHGVGYHGEAHPKSRNGPIFGELAQHEHLSIRLSGYLASFARLQRINIQSILNRGPLEDALTFHKLWFDIVNQYSSCELTRSSDRLVALSGIAQRVIAANPTMLYAAGMWVNPVDAESCPFKFDLLWWVGEPHLRPAQYTAPTWSWASQIGKIGSLGGIKTEQYSVIQKYGITINTHPLDTTHTGVVRGGYLKIRGLLKSVSTLKFIQEIGTYKSYWGMTIFSSTDGDTNKKFGFFFPDILGSFCITHLLPLRKYPQVSTEHWKTIGSGFQHNGYHGLALQKIQGKDSYLRIGFFGFEWKDGHDLEAERWFDGCEMQDIVIY